MCCGLPLAAGAQEPLSAIEWLTQNPPPSDNFLLLEPPVTQTGRGPQIEVSPLDAAITPVGLVPANITGLPDSLWAASDADDLARAIADVAVRQSAAMQTLLYTLLLAETLPPEGAEGGEALVLARIDRLMELGAVEPAQAMVRLAGVTNSGDRFARWFDATLLTGDEDSGCAVMNAAPHLAPSYDARIFCALRSGDWSAAAVMLDGARALALSTQDKLFVLDRFLNPDLYDGAPPLPVPTDPDPLTFRLFEAIGERLPTADLPRAFAVADLRDLAGWKAQLEAAERLARIGALSPNQLLGIYTARLPAASGGIWDRVEALQRFETALDTRSGDAVAKTLPAVWAAMRQAELEVPFATLFGDRLAAQPLRDPAARGLAYHIRLLSPEYEAAVPDAPDTPRDRFLATLAQGAPEAPPGNDETARAITDGFANPATPPAAIQALLDGGELGAVILRAMTLFHQGAEGNLSDLSAALATFRAIGLEDTARRAALQLMLLDRG